MIRNKGPQETQGARAVPEVCRVHCDEANPTSVVIGKTSEVRRGVWQGWGSCHCRAERQGQGRLGIYGGRVDVFLVARVESSVSGA